MGESASHIAPHWVSNPKVTSSRLQPRLANRRAVSEGRRAFSAHELRDGTRIWIITETDRFVTAVMLPVEY
jgi:hypothetical protein